jgi:hypothetical protein
MSDEWLRAATSSTDFFTDVTPRKPGRSTAFNR